VLGELRRVIKIQIILCWHIDIDDTCEGLFSDSILNCYLLNNGEGTTEYVTVVWCY